MKLYGASKITRKDGTIVWRSQAHINGKTQYFGTFDTQLEAHTVAVDMHVAAYGRKPESATERALRRLQAHRSSQEKGD